MNLHVSKWGNSLAIRIPAEFIKAMGIHEGDSVDATLTAEGGISIRPSSWDKKAFVARLDALHASMPMGTSVMDEVRRGGRY